LLAAIVMALTQVELVKAGVVTAASWWRMTGSMRYGQRGGYTPAEQQRRERLRLQAAGRFAAGDSVSEIARDLRVTPGSVRRWRRAWQAGGAEALKSQGPVSAERLSPQQWARLEAELRKGPLAHGFADDQRWTLGRIKTLIGRLFHVGYTIQGVWKLMRRHGWSCQVPVRQAMERDEAAIEIWKSEVWPETKGPRATWAPTSASRTRQAKG
jgi:putative transposase